MIWDMLRHGQNPLEEAVAVLSRKGVAKGSRPSPMQILNGSDRESLDAGWITEKTSAMLLNSGAVLPNAHITQHVVAACGTQKLLIHLQDGLQVETVLIPSEKHTVSKRRRTTLCVSSQCGCARGCIFCATGKLGLLRNLTPSEILIQLLFAQRVVQAEGLAPISNVVFMGEGEPLNNLRSVSTAVHVMTACNAFRLSPRKVTVSTVAPSPAHVMRLAALPCAIAWSLHAADNDVRRRLVPTQTCHVSDLRDAFVRVLAERGPGHHLFVELTLLSGINDKREDALQVVRLLEPLRAGGGEAPKINLIPYNDNGFEGLVPSPLEKMLEFRDLVMRAGYVCTIRRARGTPESAACGQLSGGSREGPCDPGQRSSMKRGLGAVEQV